jgi:hypothetical protein
MNLAYVISTIPFAPEGSGVGFLLQCHVAWKLKHPHYQKVIYTPSCRVQYLMSVAINIMKL